LYLRTTVLYNIIMSPGAATDDEVDVGTLALTSDSDDSDDDDSRTSDDSDYDDSSSEEEDDDDDDDDGPVSTDRAVPKKKKPNKNNNKKKPNKKKKPKKKKPNKKEEQYKMEFNAIDLDSSGYIDVQDIAKCFGGFVPKSVVARAVKAVDKNKDGKISFAEYKTIRKVMGSIKLPKKGLLGSSNSNSNSNKT